MRRRRNISGFYTHLSEESKRRKEDADKKAKNKKSKRGKKKKVEEGKS